MAFAYLRDPLFVFCFALYWVNRLVIKNIPHADFFDNYLNDLICIPFLVPMLLRAMRLCRLRNHDAPPYVHEVILPLIVWSILFEILFPMSPFWSHWVTGDPYDVFYYSIGACIALLFWDLRYSAVSVASDASKMLE